MKTIAGIDLGTTYSALAVMDEIGKPNIVADFDGNRLTPSVAHIPKDSKETVNIGHKAKAYVSIEPERVIQFVKRKMGQPSFRYNVGGVDWSAIDISALILRKLKNECTEFGEIRDVVITVPAHFQEEERKATMDAGEIAGLNVLGIINEPTAAALFYATEHEVQGKIVVYDLGGGTFDVTVMDVQGKEIQILSSRGDGRLGGVDFDRAIVQYYNDTHRKETGKPLIESEICEDSPVGMPGEEAKIYSKLLERAELDKKSLTRKDSVSRNIGSIRITLERNEFEELISTQIARTEMLIETALDDAKLELKDINKVILVGGSTRIPAVYKSLKSLFGFSPTTVSNVDEAVALGAAISAGIKLHEKDPELIPVVARQEIEKTNLTDICCSCFGTLAITEDEHTQQQSLRNTIIIENGTRLPCKKTSTYYTMLDNQKSINVRITQSKDIEFDPEYVNIIGSIPIELPLNTPRNTEVIITYSYDKNSRLHCEISIPSADLFRDVSLSYSNSDVLSKADVNQKKVDLSGFTVE